ncbi:reverse transcriptase family protein [Pseudoxanthomonas sp. 10H]|uniref:reverse transcriptase family protein n=1 Tax=Pseudoxanthomonas sp. 10H TaxID=3242729 RepID=UPI003557532A
MATEGLARKRKGRRQRLEKPKKQYALHDCALYGLKGVGQLADRLLLKPEGLDALVRLEGGYKVWIKEDRPVQEALPPLRRIHRRIATLLRRIQPPDYRHSGVRSKSFISNANQHLAPHASLKLDISKFYPSTTIHHVWKFFARRMRCAPDVAAILANLCCYQKKHLPTGGVHSEVLAFFCHKGMLDALNERVQERGGTMTVYVDDIVVTMPGACESDLKWAQQIIEQARLTMNVRKSRVIRANAQKLITGVRVHKGKLSAPAGQHHRVKMLHQAIAENPDPSDLTQKLRSLQGHLDHIAQIEPRYLPRAQGHRSKNRAVLLPPR